MYGNTATNHAHGTSLYTRGSTLGMQGLRVLTPSLITENNRLSSSTG